MSHAEGIALSFELGTSTKGSGGGSESPSQAPAATDSSPAAPSSRSQRSKRPSSSSSTSSASASRFQMKDEISAAAHFLTRLIARQNDGLSEDVLTRFRVQLDSVLHRKFADHWFPDAPSRGQAFRCIRVNENIRRDSILETVCQEIGLSFADLVMPAELTLWIDPEEVTCRFGEHKGSYCIVAQFKDGNKENYVDQINVDELEQQSLQQSQQASFDLVNARKRKQARLMAAKSMQMNAMYAAGAGSVAEAYAASMQMQPHHPSAITSTASYYSSPGSGGGISYYGNGNGSKYGTTAYSPSAVMLHGMSPHHHQQHQSSSPYSQQQQSGSSGGYSLSPTHVNGNPGVVGSGSGGRHAFRPAPGYATGSAGAMAGSGKYGTSARGLGSAFNSASFASSGGSSAAAATLSAGSGAAAASSTGSGSSQQQQQQGDRFHYVKSSLKA